MRHGNTQGFILEDRVVVKSRTPRWANHVFQLGQPANRACMADRQVVAFHKILSQHLPVSVPNVFLVKRFGIIGHIITRDHLCDLRQLIGNRCHVGIKANKNPTKPFLTSYLWQLVLVFAKPFILRHRRCAAQLTVQIIRPCVVGADDGLGVAAPVQQGGHTVQTNIAHGAQSTFAIAQHDNRLASQISRHIITRG